MDDLLRAAMQDADLYRALMRHLMLLPGAPDLTDPALVAQVRRQVAPDTRPPPVAGPTRAELTQLLAACYCALPRRARMAQPHGASNASKAAHTPG